MMIIMRIGATSEQTEAVMAKIENNGFHAHPVYGDERTVIGVVGNHPIAYQELFIQMPGVDRVMPISRPYKLTSREFIPDNSIFPLDGVMVGGPGIIVVAGPCSVESREQLMEIAHAVREAGGHALRGGAFKPRSSPYAFQGMGEKGLELLTEARAATGLPIVTEIMDPNLIPLMIEHADVLQIGARNMQNFTLLNAVGESKKPILLKRGMSATIEELLMSAEYILSHENRRVILCERGIRTFETATRNTTDINAIPVLKGRTHLPVFLDPSHSTGNWEYVTSIALAGIAAGADGLIVEVHPHPEDALSDGGQSLKPERFVDMIKRVQAVAQAVGRDLAPRSHQ